MKTKKKKKKKKKSCCGRKTGEIGKLQELEVEMQESGSEEVGPW